jgi:carboxypeptidase family protein
MTPSAQVVVSTVIAVLISGTAFGQVKSDEPVKDVRISGRVSDATGAPVRDVFVVLRLVGSDDTSATTKTNETGDYTFRVVPHRSYELRFACAGFKRETKVVTANKDTDVGTLALSVSVHGGLLVVPVGPRVEVPSAPNTGTTNSHEPIKTTLCDLVKQPQKFNNMIVQFQAEYISKFQWDGFVDDSCSAKLQVGVFHVLDDLKPNQGQYAFTTIADDNTHPERLNWKPIESPQPVQLKTDDSYRAFCKYADTKFKWPDGGTCLDCPLYRINVTATGRFDYFETQTVAVRANPATKAFTNAAGDPNVPLLRLVLVSVSDELATPIDPAVYTESKRREITLEEAHDLVTALTRDRGNTKAPGFELVKFSDPYDPTFQFFEAIWNNPVGSVNLGHYAVDRKTGDVWNAIVCERMTSASLTRLQRAIRIRIGLTESKYRKARRPGPMCE